MYFSYNVLILLSSIKFKLAITFYIYSISLIPKNSKVKSKLGVSDMTNKKSAMNDCSV